MTHDSPSSNKSSERGNSIERKGGEGERRKDIDCAIIQNLASDKRFW